MKKITGLLLILSCVAAWATVKFPYPQAHTYANGIIATLSNPCAGTNASTMLKSKFLTYLDRYYEESGNYARIKFDDANYTVSEGIGYGMIMMVYFSDNTTSYQSHFDKLWNYYQKFSQSNGIMDWKIRGFDSVEGPGGATDAEEDVAFALAMAYYQFGDEKYKTAAQSLIAAMRQNEFSSDGMHKLGSQWDSYKNPSYVSPAAYEIFKKFDTGYSSFWESAISKNYELLLKNQNASTGIPSGWADNNSYTAISGNNAYGFAGYDYDAVRAPWRWAWSYAWYGHSQANTLLSRLAPWVNSKIVTQLKINMYQDGSTPDDCDNIGGCSSNGSSIGSLSSALIYKADYQDRLNVNYQSLMMQQEGYFHSSLRVLTGLLMSGNMQDLSTATPVASQSVATIPDSCYVSSSSSAYVNSGAYGWESESAELSGETETGVVIGPVMAGNSRRWVIRALANVTAGTSYTLSLKACEESTAENAEAESNTLNVFMNDGSLCYFKSDIEPGTCVDATCTYIPVVAGTDSLNIWVWDWPGDITISDLSFVSATGEVIIGDDNTSSSSSSSSSGFDGLPSNYSQNVPTFYTAGKNVVLNVSNSAKVFLMDMQGRVLGQQTVHKGSSQIYFDKPNGNYLMRIHMSGQDFVYRVRL